MTNLTISSCWNLWKQQLKRYRSTIHCVDPPPSPYIRNRFRSSFRVEHNRNRRLDQKEIRRDRRLRCLSIMGFQTFGKSFWSVKDSRWELFLLFLRTLEICWVGAQTENRFLSHIITLIISSLIRHGSYRRLHCWGLCYGSASFLLLSPYPPPLSSSFSISFSLLLLLLRFFSSLLNDSSCFQIILFLLNVAHRFFFFFF